jgi:hypothetical protein
MQYQVAKKRYPSLIRDETNSVTGYLNYRGIRYNVAVSGHVAQSLIVGYFKAIDFGRFYIQLAMDLQGRKAPGNEFRSDYQRYSQHAWHNATEYELGVDLADYFAKTLNFPRGWDRKEMPFLSDSDYLYSAGPTMFNQYRDPFYNKGTLLCCGVSGSGKSYFVEELKNAKVIDFDKHFSYPEQHRWWDDEKLARKTNVRMLRKLRKLKFSGKYEWIFHPPIRGMADEEYDYAVIVDANVLLSHLLSKGNPEQPGAKDFYVVYEDQRELSSRNIKQVATFRALGIWP